MNVPLAERRRKPSTLPSPTPTSDKDERPCGEAPYAWPEEADRDSADVARVFDADEGAAPEDDVSC